MLPDRDPRANDPNLGVLLDALTEMPEPGEPIYSSAEEWPSKYDSIRIMLGPAIFPQNGRFDDLPNDDLDLDVEF